MVAATPPPSFPPILGGDLKISDQNYWGGGGGPEQKIKFGRRELNLRGEPKILGGTYEPQWCHKCDDIISSFLIETNNK